MNSTLQKNDETMDDLLHDYFQAELPHPWPTFRTPKPMRTKRPTSLWSRYSGRVALAACIAILASGYLTLGGFFPHTQTGSGVTNVTGDVGMGNPKGKTPKATPLEDQLPTPIGHETMKIKTK